MGRGRLLIIGAGQYGRQGAGVPLGGRGRRRGKLSAFAGRGSAVSRQLSAQRLHLGQMAIQQVEDLAVHHDTSLDDAGRVADVPGLLFILLVARRRNSPRSTLRNQMIDDQQR